MPLHAQARAFLDHWNAQPPIDFDRIDAPSLRTSMALPVSSSADPVARIDDMWIDRPAGRLRLRVYTPESSPRPWPTTLYFYGGGFVLGRPEQSDPICRALARRANTLVVSVDYRQAPEAPFPSAVADALDSLRWVQDNAGALGGDATRIAVAGDSAGGNLAAVLAQQLSRHDVALRHQLLIYPPLDPAMATSSWRDLATGHGLTAPWMRWYWRQYLPDERAARDPRASPLLAADLQGLPAATIFTAEYDPLRDEAEAYATALREAGVPVTLRRWNGQIHGFMLMPDWMDDAATAYEEAAAALRNAFAV